MRLIAKIDILENSRRHKAGAMFETDEATGLVLLRQGWAETAVMPIEAETPEKPKRKKAAK